jgi:hypothetical protein
MVSAHLLMSMTLILYMYLCISHKIVFVNITNVLHFFEYKQSCLLSPSLHQISFQGQYQSPGYLMMRLKDIEARVTSTAVARKVTPKSRAMRW